MSLDKLRKVQNMQIDQAKRILNEFEQPESECYDPCYANHKHNYPKGVSKAINEPESGQCNCECHFDTWGSSGLLKWDQTPEEKRIRSCSHCQDKEEGIEEQFRKRFW